MRVQSTPNAGTFVSDEAHEQKAGMDTLAAA